MNADALIAKIDRAKLVEALADICERDGITPEALANARIKGIEVTSKNWEAMHKDEAGQAVVTALSGGGMRLTLSPSWETGPKWPVVAPATLPRINPTKRSPKASTGNRTILLIPDVHIAHIRPNDGDAVQPAWDLEADAALRALATDLRPAMIIQLGDLLDLAEHGKFEAWPAWSRTTGPDIQAACQWWAQWRADHPTAELVMLEGNHELRLAKAMVRNNAAAFGLTPAQLPGEAKGWPAHSIPNYLRLDELGVTWVPGYPSARYWLTADLALIHGMSDPGTKDLNEHHTVIMGHWHRIVQRWLTRRDRHGAHIVGQICIGTMSPIDGRTPSGAQGLDDHGTPITQTGIDKWQQGAGVVTIDPDGAFLFEQIHIASGLARFRGQTWSG